MTLTYFAMSQILSILDGDGGGLLHDDRQPMLTVVLPMARLVRKIGEEREDFKKAQRALIDRYLEEGERPIDSGTFDRLNEDEDFLEEYAELQNTEVELDVEPIDPEELVGVDAATILALSPILQD